MRLTPFAVACILAFPSLTISAPLPEIPIDDSSLEARDPKNIHKSTVTNHPHYRIPRPQLSKQRRDIYDLYMRDTGKRDIFADEGVVEARGHQSDIMSGCIPHKCGNRTCVKGHCAKMQSPLPVKPKPKTGSGKRDAEEMMERRDHQIDMLSIRTPLPATPQTKPKPKPMTAPKPVGPKPVGSKPVGPKPAGAKPAGSKPAGSKPIGMKPSGPKPTAPKPVGSKPVGSKPSAGSGAVNTPGKKGGSGKRDDAEMVEERDHQSGIVSVEMPRLATRGPCKGPPGCEKTKTCPPACKKVPKRPKPVVPMLPGPEPVGPKPVKPYPAKHCTLC